MKDDEMDKACGMKDGEQKCIKASGGIPEGKRQFVGPSHRQEDKIKMYVKEMDEMVCTGFSWLMISMWALANTVMNLQVPKYWRKF
jgi:hypothetical protein